jgi:APA family basic amino acid/polyamine antiporter
MELSSFSVSAISRRRPITPVNSWSSNPPLNSTLVDTTAASTKSPQHQTTLKRTLHLHDLIFYGVGCSVGAGIYSLVGIGANLAGPSIALSFLLCGIACCFTSLAYAEFAARVPLAGSAYTFTYVSFGELCGWLVGWNLTLGYAVSAAVVARSWAVYMVGFVEGFMSSSTSTGAVNLTWLTKFPVPLFGADYTCCPLSTVIIGFCTLVLVIGAKESTRFNTAMTLLNLTVLGFVLISGIGSGTVHSDNLEPVFPHGISGMAAGAGLVFFAYLGFDMVACLSEECKNPERNMPIGIIGSLLVSMSIYTAVSLVVVGMAPVLLLGEDVPIINALLANACCTHSDQLLPDADETCLSFSCSPILHPLLYYGSRIISFGAIFGLTTATFSCLMGQPRIFYSMAQDGLLWKLFARVHPKTGIPISGTLITGTCTALVACLIDLESLANAISLGTLQVFTFVNAGIILLRMRPSTSQDISSPITKLNEEKSPLVNDVQAAAMARSLGLVKQTSSQIRHSIQNSVRVAASVDDNGTKPVWLVVVFTASAILASMTFSRDWPVVSVVAFCIVAIVCTVGLFLLPLSPPPDTFTCPMVPGVPLMGILCNSYMMGSMPSVTWKAILAWLLVGLLFYFGYGIHHSELRGKHGDGGDGALIDTFSEEQFSKENLSQSIDTAGEGYGSLLQRH